MYVNVGARHVSDGSDIPTKSALKRAVADNPAQILFYETSLHKVYEQGTVDNLPTAVKFTVVGPNPYTSRKWYATVEKLTNGTIRVS